MQTAEALLEIIHERGKKGLPLERLYRHLFNPELYLRAYGRRPDLRVQRRRPKSQVPPDQEPKRYPA
jgi:hypothetical protein